MGLRIQNNIAAMNAHKQLQLSDAGMSKSLERLSSGYRINRAADDAAGLSISSGFRADIASFKVASRNTSEANALLQVAEGGMEQIENMLTRLKELATQAASANVGVNERAKINAEGNALISEIDRIANSTKYGSTALLDGTFGASKTAGTYQFSGATFSASMAGVYGDMKYVYTVVVGQSTGISGSGFTITSLAATQVSGAYTFSADDAAAGQLKIYNGTMSDIACISFATTASQTVRFANLGLTFTVALTGAVSASWCGATLTVRDTGVTNLNVTGAATGSYEFSTGAGTGALTLVNTATGAKQTISNINPGTAQEVNFDLLNVTFSLGAVYTENDLEAVSFVVSDTGSSGSTFQIGAENNDNNRISLAIGNVKGSVAAGLSLEFDYLDTAADAQSMLDTVDAAISTLASARGTIGASMNRLSYAAANLATTIENTQAAESVIRDVDMADEMTTFTKNQILVQAGTAMLAQANQAPQLMLTLLGR
ncbi:MAG TPA: flagellin [Syntrophales bacterium]|nr:flagellin [Syntrophales bacterium]